MALAAFLGAAGQLVMKLIATVLNDQGLTLGVVLLGSLVFSVYGGIMWLFLQGLRHGRELSTTYPVYSLTFPFAALLGWLTYGEEVSLGQWAGLLLVCAGVALMNKPPKPRSTEKVTP
jgi:drug/metabolite transporter (DMT)-like permease